MASRTSLKALDLVGSQPTVRHAFGRSTSGVDSLTIAAVPVDRLARERLALVRTLDPEELRRAYRDRRAEFFRQAGTGGASAELRAEIENLERVMGEAGVEIPTDVGDPYKGLPLSSITATMLPRGMLAEHGRTKVSNYSARTGMSRELEVKEEEHQRKLDDAMSHFRTTLAEENPLQAYLDTGPDGKPVVHRVVIYRDGNPTHYDLLEDAHLEKLLRENGFGEALDNGTITIEGKRAQLLEVAAELDEASEKISPRTGKRPQYSSGELGNLSGPAPFAEAGTRVGGLFQDEQFMKNTMVKALSDPRRGLVDPETGHLNARGERALKEMTAASLLIDKELEKLSKKRAKLDGRRERLESSPGYDPLERNEDVEEIKAQVAALDSKIAELQQAKSSQLAIAYMIMELNQPVNSVAQAGDSDELIGQATILERLDGDPVTITAREALALRSKHDTITLYRGGDAHEMTVEAALTLGEVYYWDEHETQALDIDALRNETGEEIYRFRQGGAEFSPQRLRRELADRLNLGFRRFLPKVSKSWYQAAAVQVGGMFFESLRASEAPTKQEQEAAARMGGMFFESLGAEDRGPEDSFRIRHMMYNQSKQMKLTRPVYGASIIQHARAITEAAESAAPDLTLPSFGSGLESIDGLSEKVTREIPTRVMNALRSLHELTVKDPDPGEVVAKPWTEMSPRVAVEFLRDRENPVVPDDRWDVTKFFSRNRWRRSASA